MNEMTVVKLDSLNNDYITIELRIPKDDVVKLSRREFADKVYDLMVKPLDILADPLIPKTSTVPVEEHGWIQLPNIPHGWHILWCSVCFFSMTFDDDVAITYGLHWDSVMMAGFQHTHDEVKI